MPKISALSEITNPEPDDILAGVEDSDETTKYIKVSTLLKFIYPVGSIYINRTDDTSPATLFGFGTWVRIQGRTIVGVSDSDADFSVGVTGGQKDVMAHSHIFRRPLNVVDSDRGTSSSLWSIDLEQDQPTSVTGTGENNMNPYFTAYVWERTA